MNKITLDTIEWLRGPSGWLPEKRRLVAELDQELVISLYQELVERILAGKISRPEVDTLRVLEARIPNENFTRTTKIEHIDGIYVDGEFKTWYSRVKIIDKI